MVSHGVSAKEMTKRQGLTLQAVYERRYRWLAEGVAGMPDAPHSGPSSKLSLDQLEQLKAWGSDDALTATALLARLEDEFGLGYMSVHLPEHSNGHAWSGSEAALNVSWFAGMSACCPRS